MMRSLWLKDWRAHRIVTLVSWFLIFGLFAATMYRLRNAGSPLDAFRGLVIVSGMVLPFVFVNRLVVSEYSGQTQFFLETLPITRVTIVLTKWMMGLTLMLIPLLICFAIALYQAHSHAVITAPQLYWMSLRWFSFLLFVYSLTFAIAFTGRYRFVAWGALFFAALFVNEMAQLPLDRWPPLHLALSDSVVYPHNEVPWFEIAATWILIATLLLATLLLSLSKEGSIIAGLYARMSNQEKVVLVIICVVMAAAVSQVEQRKPKPPFRLQQAMNSREDLPAVSVQHNASLNRDQAAQLSDELALTLKDIQAYLQLSALPAVAVIPDASLDADVFMLASMPQNDGLVVRAAINSTGFDRSSFKSFVLRHVFEWYSNGHGVPEEQQWLLDGFIQWWLINNDSQKRQMTLRATVADQQFPLQLNMLTNWMTTREQLGDCMSDAVAWGVVSNLAERIDTSSFKSLMRKLFSERPKPDARYWFEKSELQKELTKVGVSMKEIVNDMQQKLQADQSKYAGAVDNLHLLHVQFSANRMRGKNYEIKYDIGGSGKDNKEVFSIRYQELEPWQGELQATKLSRVDALDSGVLPLTVQRGARVFTATEMRSDALQCTVRAGARRWEVK